ETGKLADFVILSDDPTAIDPETLSSLTVQATIKNDRVVYEADGSMQKTEFLNWPVGPDGEASHHLLHAMYDGMSKK
ncbi:hypothetical protein JF546_15630, partial [Nitratireductor aquimarinus]|nr:hypothetical protein [Nitratireductor aquibiodomus]MBN8244449.1 hypothetical protein [Nitratireductor aquimarinus]